MPKKFDKKNSVGFRVVWKATDDPEENNKLLSERIFSLVEPPKSKQTPEYLDQKKKALAMFTKQELGVAQKKKKKKAETGEDDVAYSQVKGREDLWITHLMRMRQAQEEAEAEEESDDDNEAPQLVKPGYKKSTVTIPKAKPKPEKKKTEKKGDGEGDEEWESCEGDDDEEWEDEDGEEFEIEEWEEEEEDEEDGDQEIKEIVKKQEKVEKIEKIVKEQPKKEKKEEKKVNEIISTKKEEPKSNLTDEDEDQNVDLANVKYSDDVKTRRFDAMGLPISRYNYKQHLVEPTEGGPAQFSFTANYEKPPELAIEVDIPLEKMNAEEKEVFEALQYEAEDGAYEEMDDDFFNELTGGKKFVLSEEEKAKKLEENKKKEEEKKANDKKVSFANDKASEITTQKKQPLPVPVAVAQPDVKKDAVYNKRDFMKVLNDHIEVMKDKYRDEREANRKRYKLAESESEEEEEEFSDGEEDVDREEAMKFFNDKIPFEKDIAMQQMMMRGSSESESEDETQITGNDEKISSAQFPTGPAPKLNVVAEAKDKKAKKPRKNDKDEEASVANDKDDSNELNLKKEELFNKREKNETKEQKAERKKLVKQFKEERKDKKKKFKETFDNKKKHQKDVAQKQAKNLQGLSIYKLS